MLEVTASLIAIISLGIALFALGFQVGIHASHIRWDYKVNVETIGEIDECASYLKQLGRTSLRSGGQTDAFNRLIEALYQDKRIVSHIVQRDENDRHNQAVLNEIERRS